MEPPIGWRPAIPRSTRWMLQPSQWLEWLHSAFARLRFRSLAPLEVAANKKFQRTRANRRERPPAFAMQKIEGSSPFIRFRKPAIQCPTCRASTELPSWVTPPSLIAADLRVYGARPMTDASVSASMSALSVRCSHLRSVGVARESPRPAKCQPGSAPVSSCPVLAMQKVEGSSPFIRSRETPTFASVVCTRNR
jgi:hypothetical protein